MAASRITGENSPTDFKVSIISGLRNLTSTCGAHAFMIYVIDDDDIDDAIDDAIDDNIDDDDIADDDDDDEDDTWLALVEPMLGDIAPVATLPLIILHHFDDDHDDHDGHDKDHDDHGVTSRVVKSKSLLCGKSLKV